MDAIIMLLGLVDFLLFFYLYYVGREVKKDSFYKAVCDINEPISCTGFLKTRYATTFGIQNSILGIAYSLIIMYLASKSALGIVFALTIPAVCYSIFLIYVSYFRIRKFCIICHTAYIVTFIIAILTYIRL